MRKPWLGTCAAIALMALACGGEESGRGGAPAAAPPADAPSSGAASGAAAGANAAAAVAEARSVFETRCATCHGASGMGDGPGSQALDPPPRNFRDPAWQDSVDDEHLRKIILYGGAAVGRSAAMPGNPDLIAKPDVVAALVAHIRSLRSD